MTNREFADSVTSLLNDPSGYKRVSIANLMVIEGAMQYVLDGVREEIHRRKRPKLALVKK